MFWSALQNFITTNLNFTELKNLAWINIGASDYSSGFGARLLPQNLEFICIYVGKLPNFLNFALYTQNIRDIMLRRNDINYIPRTAIFGLSLLRKLGMNENKLLTLPDLFHLPTRELTLCWIRMSPWFNPPLSIDDMICKSPHALGVYPWCIFIPWNWAAMMVWWCYLRAESQNWQKIHIWVFGLVWQFVSAAYYCSYHSWNS